MIRSYYYGNISFLDAMIGRVMNQLEEMNLIENTLVLFASDHGDLLGDFGSCFKTNHLNGSVRIPFLAAGPGVVRGKVCDEFVGLQDLLPTFSDLAGAVMQQSVQGLSFASLLGGEGSFHRDEYYATTENECGFSVMLVNKHWKYIYSEAGATEELYDQLQDPQELDNRAGQSACKIIQDEMRSRLMAAAHSFHDNDIFEGESLRSRTVDREEFTKISPTGIGWRFY